MENLREIIAENIAALRTKRGMTQSELAEKLNYSDKSVSKWERAEGIPDVVVLKSMADIFGVTVDYMLTEHNAEEEVLPEEEQAAEGEMPAAVSGDMSVPTRRRMIIGVVMAGIWTLALLAFIIVWLCGRIRWIIFVGAIPVSLITLLVLHSIWEGGKNNFQIISALCASIVCTVYLSFIRHNWWQLFLLLIPAELIVILCFRIKNPPK